MLMRVRADHAVAHTLAQSIHDSANAQGNRDCFVKADGHVNDLVAEEFADSFANVAPEDRENISFEDSLSVVIRLRRIVGQ